MFSLGQSTCPRAEFLRVTAGTFLLCLVSKLYLPLTYVPITFHTTAVLWMAFTFPLRSVTLALGTWISLGFMGLPVFSSVNSGLVVMLGPSAGYIYGFLGMAWIVGTLKNRWSGIPLASLACAVTYGVGLMWMYPYVQNLHTTLDLGLYPFVIPELGKLILLSFLLRFTPVDV